MSKIGSALMTAGAIVIAMLFAGCSSFSENVQPADITVLELENRMSLAADPDGRYENAASYILRQQVETERFLDVPDRRMIEVKYLQPGYLKLTTYNENEPESGLIVNGNSAWAVDFERNKVLPIPEKDLSPMLTMTRLNDPRSRFHEIFSSVTIDKAEIAGETFYRLSCDNDLGSKICIYVDPDTYLIRRMRAVFNTSYGKLNYESVMRSYALYEGIRIANESESTQDGLTQQVRVIDYQLNPPLKPDDFLPPIL